MAETKIINLKVVVDGDTDVKQLEKDILKVVDANKKVEDSGKKAGSQTEEAFKGANSAASNLKGGFAGVAQQIVVVGKAAKKGGAAMRTALISTGIGALIVALGLVVEYWDEIGELLTGVNEELEEQLKLQELISLELDRRVKNNQTDLRNQRNREKREILRAKILGANEKVITEIKRKGFLERQQIAEKELREAKDLAKRAGKLDAETNAAARKELERSYKALTKARLDAEIFDLEQQVPDNKKGRSGKRDKIKGIGDALTAEEQQALLDKKAEQFSELFDLETYQANELSKARLEIEEKDTYIAGEQAEARVLIAKYEEQAKREALEGYAGALSTISGAIGQETAAGKALAVASSLINTYAAITGQLKAFSGVPVPGYAIAQAIATGVAGFANVKKILSVKVPNHGGGNSISGASQPSAPSFNVVGNSGVSQIAQTLNQEQQPIEAYVVAGNVSSAQELNRSIIDTATIG